MKLPNWKTRSLIGLAAFAAAGAPAAPGTISTALSPASPITIGATFTVTLNLSGYTGPTEIDGYNFRVTFPSNLFSLVAGSLALHDASGFGATENWLRKPPQDGVGVGAVPLDDSTLSSAGVVNISAADLRLSSTRGTTTGAGFLYSFDLKANALGAGSITPAAALDGSVLFDVNLSTAGVPAFSGASMTVSGPVMTNLVVSASPTTVYEGATSQLSASAAFNDGTVSAVAPSGVTWSVVSGPVSSISGGGLATAANVYQDTAATVRGDYLGKSGTRGLTVLNIHNDDYGSYAGDGLPDDWQVQNFGPNNSSGAPAGDPDGDGQNNYFEYVAGTTPTDLNSRFTFSIENVPGQPRHKLLTFSPRLPGRTYTVQYGTNLESGGFSPLTNTLTTDAGTTRMVTDTNAGDTTRFYRVSISLPPPDVTPPTIVGTSPAANSIATGLDSVMVFFDEPLNPATLTADNFRLTFAGADGVFGTGDDVVLANGIISFLPASNAAVMSFPANLTSGLYRGVIANVLDLAGNALAAPLMWAFWTLPGAAGGDADGDGLTNQDELNRGTNPLLADTDGDGWADEVEVSDGTDPLNPASHPKQFFVARPPVEVTLPAIGETTEPATGTTLAKPPVTIQFGP